MGRFFYKKHHTIDEFLTSDKTIDIINDYLQFDSSKLNGFGTDFIISGNFIHNILINKKANELDFCILTKKGFVTILDFFSKNFNYIRYSITTYGIDLNIDSYPYVVKLFNTIEWTILQCIDTYTIEYSKCYFDGKNIKISPECERIIKEKKIYFHTLSYKEIEEATNNGYKFRKESLKALDIIDICLNKISKDGDCEGYIGMNFHDLTNKEIENLKRLVKLHECYENDKYFYIFVINNSLDIMKQLLPLIYKYKPKYKNLCDCDCCNFIDNNDNINNSDVINENEITFEDIIKFLHENIL